MTWYDFIVFIGQALFAIALLPAIIGNKKPPISTCLMTGAVLLAFNISYLKVGMWWSVATTTVCALCWLWLAIQQIRAPQTRLVEVNGDDQVHHENGVYLGEFVMDVDGYYYFYPDLKGGHWSAAVMREICDLLDARNAEWDREIRSFMRYDG